MDFVRATLSALGTFPQSVEVVRPCLGILSGVIHPTMLTTLAEALPWSRLSALLHHFHSDASVVELGLLVGLRLLRAKAARPEDLAAALCHALRDHALDVDVVNAAARCALSCASWPGMEDLLVAIAPVMMEVAGHRDTPTGVALVCVTALSRALPHMGYVSHVQRRLRSQPLALYRSHLGLVVKYRTETLKRRWSALRHVWCSTVYRAVALRQRRWLQQRLLQQQQQQADGDEVEPEEAEIGCMDSRRRARRSAPDGARKRARAAAPLGSSPAVGHLRR